MARTLDRRAQSGQSGRVPTSGGGLYRTRYIWWVFAVFYGFVFLLTAATALNSAVPVIARLVCGFIGVAIVGFMIRARRAGIEITSNGVLVRQYSGRTFRIVWPDVDSFVLTSTSPLNPGVYVAVRLKDGRLIKTQGLVASSRRSKAGGRVVEELESRRPC